MHTADSGDLENEKRRCTKRFSQKCSFWCLFSTFLTLKTVKSNAMNLKFSPSKIFKIYYPLALKETLTGCRFSTMQFTHKFTIVLMTSWNSRKGKFSADKINVRILRMHQMICSRRKKTQKKLMNILSCAMTTTRFLRQVININSQVNQHVRTFSTNGMAEFLALLIH